jgi:hypothetical protein
MASNAKAYQNIRGPFLAMNPVRTQKTISEHCTVGDMVDVSYINLAIER